MRSTRIVVVVLQLLLNFLFALHPGFTLVFLQVWYAFGSFVRGWVRDLSGEHRFANGFRGGEAGPLFPRSISSPTQQTTHNRSARTFDLLPDHGRYLHCIVYEIFRPKFFLSHNLGWLPNAHLALRAPHG